VLTCVKTTLSAVLLTFCCSFEEISEAILIELYSDAVATRGSNLLPIKVFVAMQR
jgi:hypothetical protein